MDVYGGKSGRLLDPMLVEAARKEMEFMRRIGLFEEVPVEVA